MPLEAPLAPVADRVADLNRRYQHHSATAVLEHALFDPQVGQLALVSSFGAESVALLHMLSVIDRTTPVLFLDTEMLFPETLTYQQEVADKLGLTDVRMIRPEREQVFARDPDGILHLSDPDACCALRKTEPLQKALEGFEAWVTGRKRFQTASRAALEFFEDEDDQRIKVNPLAHWSRDDVQDYITNNRLPRHPLASKGYPSLGCTPCTSRVAEGEDPRAGRWRGQDKDECGIHFIGGNVYRGAVVVTDDGFRSDDLKEANDIRELGSDTDPAALPADLDDRDVVRVNFDSFADGRIFTIARELRDRGFAGRLRAKGPLIADQYAMARRAGFDEVEIPPELATRQPEADWLFRADWQENDYQSRLRG